MEEKRDEYISIDKLVEADKRTSEIPEVLVSFYLRDEIAKLSYEELKSNLITSDYRGKEYKELCLNELVGRLMKTQWGQDNGPKIT